MDPRRLKNLLRELRVAGVQRYVYEQDGEKVEIDLYQVEPVLEDSSDDFSPNAIRDELWSSSGP